MEFLKLVTKSLGLESFGNFVPSLKKAFEIADKNKDKSFIDKVGIFFDSFTTEMDLLDRDKKDIAVKTEDKVKAVLAEIPEVAKQNFFEKVKTSETLFIGDSITYLMGSSLGDSEKIVKGGKQTGWMKENFDKFLAEKAKGMHKNIKRISILGGFNDLTSLKSLDSIKANLGAMCKGATDAGLSVVLCTLPKWGYESGLEIFKRDFKKFGWNKGVYPLSVAELESRTKDLNKWIMAQSGASVTVVDLFTEMHGNNKYALGDYIHFYGKSAANVAALIKERGNIRDV